MVDKNYFQGLPSPSAAGVVASLVWLGSSYEMDGPAIAVPVAVLTILAAGLMISSMRYFSFKNIDFKGRVPFFSVVLAVLIIAGIALNPPEVLFGLFFIYMFSGPIFTLIQLRKMRKQRKG